MSAPDTTRFDALNEILEADHNSPAEQRAALAAKAAELGIDPYLVGDDGETLDPDELVEADYRGRKFMVPRGQYLATTFTVTQLKAGERLAYLEDNFEEAERARVVGLYDWAAEDPENASFLNTLALLGLQSRLASSKKAGEIMGSTAMPIVYCRVDQVMNKTEFERAVQAAVSAQRAQGNSRVARAVEEVAGLKSAIKRAYVVAFEEAFDADGNDQTADPRVVVGVFVYKEPSRKLRGPDAMAMSPEALGALFQGVQTDQGRLVSFDLGGLQLIEVGEHLQQILRQHEAYVTEVAAGDVPFDTEDVPAVDLTSDLSTDTPSTTAPEVAAAID